VEDTEFAWQLVHAVLPFVENVFSGQSVHVVEAIPALDLPAGQAVQVLKSDCNMYPGAHLHVPLYTL
jgi:hypothetical protein